MTGVPAPTGPPAWVLSPHSKALCPGSNAEVFHAQPGMACPHICATCGQRVSSAYWPTAVGGGRINQHYPPNPQLDIFDALEAHDAPR